MRTSVRLIAALTVTDSLLGVSHAADARPSQLSGFTECKGSGDVVEVKGGVTCKLAKKVVTGIYYDGKGTQVNDHRTDYLGFKCAWPNEDGYSMSCRSKRSEKKQINFFSD
jgi:hypothetical protein